MESLAVPCALLLAVGAVTAAVMWGVGWRKRALAAEKMLGRRLKDLRVRGEE